MTIGEWAVAWCVLALLVVAAVIACNPGPASRVNITPQMPTHGPGTLAGKTPIIGYRLICSDGITTWSIDSVVVHPDWPPSEAC